MRSRRELRMSEFGSGRGGRVLSHLLRAFLLHRLGMWIWMLMRMLRRD
jgi:hypothetical protein